MEYKIVKTNTKKLKIIINQIGEVIVRANPRASLESIDKFVNANIEWINKNRDKILAKNKGIGKYEAKEGDKVYVYGNLYEIKVIKEGISQIKDGMLELYVPDGDNLKALKNFYKELTKTSILPQANRMAYLLHFVGVEFKVSSATTAWGLCKSSEENPSIRLNWRLALIPAYLTDYVIVHELCHLFYPNHSKDFWTRVGIYMPDYKERVEELKNFSWAVAVI